MNMGVADKIERYKERLVAKGYSHKESIDFHEIFSPDFKFVSIRVVLVLVASLDLELEHLDVKKNSYMDILMSKYKWNNHKSLFKIAGKCLFAGSRSHCMV